MRTVILYLTLVINVIAMFSTIVGVLLHVEVHWGVAELAKVRDVVFYVQSEAGQVLCVAVLLKFD